ncbi:MAG TPA: trypsin-like peptidase domain-containing protein [Bryobacteraceae bacterium]|jgi:Do/DeqQ family serine protease
MRSKIFSGRRWMAVASLTTALAVTGILGLTAATTGNPPANVKVATTAPSHGGYSAVVKQVLPAVVNISSSRTVSNNQISADMPDEFFRQFFGNQFRDVPQDRREKALGSGVIVSPEGYILTNNHVVDGATDVTVTLHDKRELKARVVGTDPRTDIAVLKVEGSNFPTLTLADSSKVEVGDVVLAIGDPFGVGKTVTQGIVSATGRGGLGIEEVEDFIQTDASINPGNSGGALVDDQGHLIAINTAILGSSGGSEGIGFAVPVNLAKYDMDQIVAHGKVERGYMGIVPEDAEGSKGATVKQISANGPASKSELKTGDVIVAVNGQSVEDANQLRLKVSMLAPNAKVDFKVMRDGKPLQVAMTLGDFPETQERAAAPQQPQRRQWRQR